MGCTNSKLDDIPAVALCRDRCGFLDEAIRQRYILSRAHLGYFHSLKNVGASLNRFFDHQKHLLADAELLNPPTHRKTKAIADPHKVQPSSTSAPKTPPSPLLNLPKSHLHQPHHSHSNSGSHLHLHSDDDSDDHSDHHHDSSASGSLRHNDHSDSPSSLLHQYGHFGGYPDSQTFGLGLTESYPPPSHHGGGGGGAFVPMNFMRNQTTPSVSYQQQPPNPEIVRMGEASTSSSSYSYYPYPNAQNNDQNTSFYPPYFNYPNYGTTNFPASSPPRMMMSYRGSSSSPAVGASSLASTSKEPPPPPSPPRASAWEFLNPFESFDKYYPPYTPSRDSREVREEEGIPDLEEEDYQQEVVKEVHGNQKFVDGSEASLEDEEEDKQGNSEALYRPRPSVGMENDGAEYEVHVLDKKVFDDEDRPAMRANVAGFKTRGGFKGDSEIVREIHVQFERASESGNELTKILEVGKLPYDRKHAAYQVSSKMLHAISPSLSVVSSQPSTSKSVDIDNVDPALLDAESELNLRSKNLSSTLQKLYLWEKKLYEEVKVEEKMRILHERKCRKLKRLDEKGAESHKVDATRAMVRSLSTKIRIAIQVVDKISVKINRLRDEELWPQLHEFIQGLARMWKSMLECHHNQRLAIGEAKHLDVVASGKHFSEAHIEATSQLEHDVISWTVQFSYWIGAQKGYVRALNNWLMKCLLYVPEETPDGLAPFSPGRIGAPPVFVICNQWSQAFDRVSEKEVLDTMRDFATSVLHLWEQDKLEIRQRMTASKDTERKIKNLDREDQKLQKEIQALDKRMVLVSGDDNGVPLIGQVVYQSDATKSGSLQVGLQRIFEAMERFTANSLSVYEELLQRIEEDIARKPEKVS